MIDIKNKVECCGCNACGDICPTQAITFNTDEEGFWYPKVNLDKCINCELCEKVCPIIHEEEVNKTNIDFPNPEVFAAYNTNHDVRFISTTGGLFSALAEKTLDEDGYVGGAVWTEDFSVRHIVSNNPDDLIKIRGSKYLQSDLEGFYKNVKSILNDGNKVLVCGCPCQMAGLRRFLRKDYENLIIVDFICCSINSPLLFKEYIKDLENRYGAKMISYHPKNKEYGGWHNFAFKATFENGKVYFKNRTEDEFTKCFIGTHVAGRPSCYDCKFKKIPRITDITIADFWGIENVDPEFDSSYGVSLVLLNNNKGRQYYNSLGNKVISKPETLEDAIKGNANLIRSETPSKVNREMFYATLRNEGFRKAMDKYGNPKHPLHIRMISFSKRLIRKILRSARVSFR